MEAPLHASLHMKRLTEVSHLTLAYMMGSTYIRSDGRLVGRLYDDVITRISRMDGLPYFLSNRAPRAINSFKRLETKRSSLGEAGTERGLARASAGLAATAFSIYGLLLLKQFGIRVNSSSVSNNE